MKTRITLAVVLSFLLAVTAVPLMAQVFTSISLADGTQFAPTMGFLADSTAGFYRATSSGAGVVGTNKIALPRIQASITPGSQAANTCATQAFTVTGVAATDQVVLVLAPTTGNATGYGASFNGGANTVNQVVCNPTAGALTPAAGTFIYLVTKTQ